MVDREAEVIGLVRDMNSTWVENRPGDLERYFHKDIVMVKPGVGALATGRNECIESYKGFCSGSKLISYSESGHRADVYGNTAIVNYRYEIEYEAEGQEFHGAGFDIFVLLREGGKWQAIWRTMQDS